MPDLNYFNFHWLIFNEIWKFHISEMALYTGHKNVWNSFGVIVDYARDKEKSKNVNRKQERVCLRVCVWKKEEKSQHLSAR